MDADGSRRWRRSPEQQREPRAAHLSLVGRLAPGATLAQAQAQADAVAARLRAAFPTTNAGVEMRLIPLTNGWSATRVARCSCCFGVVALVLLIACVNVANLLLARALTRERELAIRAALGAGRGRLVRQLLTECTVLVGVRRSAGMAAAAFTLGGLVRLLSPIVPRVDAIGIDAGVLVFAVGVSTLTGLAFGLVPALQRRERASALHEAGRGGDRRGWRPATARDADRGRSRARRGGRRLRRPAAPQPVGASVASTPGSSHSAC